MIYTNKFINSISLILTIIIFTIINVFFLNKSKIPNNKILDIITNFEKVQEKKEEEKIIVEQAQDLGTWYLEISSINLKAPIAEGTSMEILNTNIGHFEETEVEVGNVGLAGHNRGYEKNYFENLKKVNIGDEIIYKHENFEKKYIIDKIEIILNTDWSYLENTEENKITLITCVENEPQYRRCVQATENK